MPRHAFLYVLDRPLKQHSSFVTEQTTPPPMLFFHLCVDGIHRLHVHTATLTLRLHEGWDYSIADTKLFCSKT